AGLGRGAGRTGLAIPLVAVSVGDPAAQLEAKVVAIWQQARVGTLPSVPITYLDAYVGGGYGVTTPEELVVQAQFTRLSGLILDPTYTGKAVYALRREIERGRFEEADQVIFWHTGGGFAAFAQQHPLAWPL
ncbi:MAG: hypothetical protein ACRDWX_08445, partial [Acidimicrobiia bacterium]